MFDLKLSSFLAFSTTALLQAVPSVVDSVDLVPERQSAKVTIVRPFMKWKCYELDNGMTLLFRYKDPNLSQGSEISWIKEDQGIRIYFETNQSMYLEHYPPFAKNFRDRIHA